MAYDPVAGMRRRQAAAARMTPLASGHRDPNRPRTDAPDKTYLQICRDAWTACRSCCPEHADNIRHQIQRRATNGGNHA